MMVKVLTRLHEKLGVRILRTHVYVGCVWRLSYNFSLRGRGGIPGESWLVQLAVAPSSGFH